MVLRGQKYLIIALVKIVSHWYAKKKIYKGVLCNMTSSSNSFQSTRPSAFRKNYPFFLEFTRNYERSGILSPGLHLQHY